MQDQKKKITKMANEVFRYLMEKEGENIHINLREEKYKFIIVADAKLKLTDEDMEYISSNFARHKDMEYELYFELMGETSDEDELELLFLLADDIRIYYEEEIIKFIIEVDK